MTFYDVPVAELRDGDRGPEWLWRAEASQRWGVGSRIISAILPVAQAGALAGMPAVRAFITGLLPEGNIRSHMAFDAGVATDDVFGLIRAFGRDTAGALTFASVDASAGPGRWEPVDEEAVARMLRRALEGYSPAGLQSTSLAGVQPKIALYRRGGGAWMQCLDGAPSTHILKVGQPPGSPLADVIHTEAACLELASRVGLGQVQASVERFSDLQALVVRRFDRTVSDDGSVRRTHQEDMAQALGLDTSDLDRKFQYGKRLPSLRAMAEVLKASGADADQLLALTTFNVAVGNTDAHAKNIGVLRPERGLARIADAYDIAMHGHHPLSSGRSAMDVNGKQVLSEITVDDLVAEGRSWGLPDVRAVRATRGLLERLQAAVADIDRDSHPGVGEAAWSVVDARLASLLS